MDPVRDSSNTFTVTVRVHRNSASNATPEEKAYPMTRPVIVAIFAALLLLAFGGAAYFYRPNETTQTETAATSSTAPLVRPHAVVLGEKNAPVTIVEFFRPCLRSVPGLPSACEEYPREICWISPGCYPLCRVSSWIGSSRAHPRDSPTARLV